VAKVSEEVIEVYYLEEAPYQETWELQERLRARVLSGGPETLLLCEHRPVLTLGRNADPADILAEGSALCDSGVERIRSNRGGCVTYHGPGQLVAYPVVRLRRGVVAHVEWLAAAAIELAAQFGVCAEFCRERIGVFVGPRKLAAIGVHVSRRVAIHGLALNITRAATSAFEHGWFVPCGEPSGQAVSLQEALAEAKNPGEKSAVVAPSETPLQKLSAAALALPFAEALCRRAGLRPPSLTRLLSPSLFVK
jgi:lipoyl(octanoyl) transferase